MATSYDLLSVNWVRTLAQSRYLQLSLLLLTSMGYSLAIVTGFFGTPVGSSNFSTIWVWLVWWGIFVVLFLPFFGRLWCAVCPIPVGGEWLQRQSFFNGSFGKKIKLSPRFFPTRLQGMWVSNVFFFGFAVFAGKLTTNPRLTAMTLLLLLTGSIYTAFQYRERSFCRHLCPIGGSISMYSLMNPIELRVKSEQVCKEHHSKDCIFGNEESFGCPWMVYPGVLKRNSNCGLCMECVRACQPDNIALNFRMNRDDLLTENPKTEEAIRSLLLLGISVIYPIIFLGTSNSLTSLSNFKTPIEFFVFSLIVAVIFLVIIPAYLYLPNLLFLRRNGGGKEYEIILSLTLSTLPLGLSGLIGFTFDILSRNASYAVNTLNDPFGAGWRLLGINPLPYSPFFPQFFSLLSALLLIVGYFLSTGIVDRVSRMYFFEKPDSDLFFRMMNYIVLFGLTGFMLNGIFGGIL